MCSKCHLVDKRGIRWVNKGQIVLCTTRSVPVRAESTGAPWRKAVLVTSTHQRTKQHKGNKQSEVQCVLYPRSSSVAAAKNPWTVSYATIWELDQNQIRLRRRPCAWPYFTSHTLQTFLKQLRLHKLCPLQMSASTAAPPHFHGAWYPSNRSNHEAGFNCGRSLRYGAMALTGIHWRNVMCGLLCRWTADSLH